MTVRRRPRPVGARVAFAAGMLLLVAGFLALGIWQVERRAWKHALIAAVADRIHAAPAAAPGPAEWSRLSAGRDAYRRITASGHFLHDREALVRATTTLGSGYWVMTPFRTAGFTLWINRGFVPPERRDPASRAAGNPAGRVTVVGLLRMSEPKGGFLRNNDPAQERWYSRDVGALSTARRLADAAPYFVDADNSPNAGGYPVGGLTVLRFSDNHLVYALTWFALAALSAWGVWRILRTPRGRGRQGESA